MTLEMGRVETQAQESPRAAAQEAVATAVAQVSAQAQPVESSGVSRWIWLIWLSWSGSRRGMRRSGCRWSWLGTGSAGCFVCWGWV